MLALGLGTFVTYNPRSILTTTGIDEALALMEDLGIHHLPVVDALQQVVGIVSHRDLAGHRPPNGDPANSTVARVMARSVFTIDEAASPSVALQAILDHGFHCVPVLEEGKLVGMITSTDYLRELSYGELPLCHESVGEHMVSLPGDELLFSAANETDALVEESSVVSPDQTLGTAASLMLAFGVREIVVVDDISQPIGVLRDDDILRALVNFLA